MLLCVKQKQFYLRMTIREAIQYTQDQLGDIYDEGESAAIAKWVLEHITGQRMDRYQPAPCSHLKS